MLKNTRDDINKPGPAQVGDIYKAPKQQNELQVSIYSFRKSKKQKIITEWRSGARQREPLAR